MISRRHFLQVALKATATASLSGSLLTACSQPTQKTRFSSAASDHHGQHYMLGLDGQLNETFRIVLPERAHEVRFNQPLQHALAFARRPGHYIQVYDALTQERGKTITPAPGRLFYGHGDFDHEGRYLYATENAFGQQKGVIGIYDAYNDYERVGEWDAMGMGSHEIRFEDGLLYVANGGILTHPDTPRVKLNITSMKPNLTVLNAASGKLVRQFQLPDHQASIRHMDVANGKVAIGLQHQTRSTESGAITAFCDGQRFVGQSACAHVAPEIDQYIASVAFGPNNQVVYTAPRGNQVLVVDHQADELVKTLELRDVAGVAYDRQANCYWLTSSTGVILPLDANSLTFNMGKTFSYLKWDNHLRFV